MKQKFVVSYQLDYVHSVSVGIEAQDQAEAQQIAEQAFNDAVIWDDSETMPLLSDDYHEAGDEAMVWDCEPVEHYPEADYSVQRLKQEQAAFRVCRGLIEAYQQGEASGGSIAWEDLDQLLPLALEAMAKKSLES
jgi:hypothetical protein